MEKGSKIVLETEIFTPPTLEAISREHMVDMDFLMEQYELGSKEELEHTPDMELAEAIALHHLYENPNYYIILRKALEEEEADKLEGYYAKGGAITCEQLDENGERKIDMESIDDLTQCVTSLPQTKSMHFDYESNQYTPERRRLHKDIIYNIKKDIVCIESDEPIAILMGGSPASGKSTFLKKYSPYLLNEEILKIDADDIRSKLPEYRGFNATQTHLETKDIVNNLLSDRNIGLPCRFDVIYDGTMNNTKSYIPLINLLKQLGYRVFIVYIDKVDKDVIVKRALERYKKSGRFVPLEVIDDFFDKGTSAMEQLKFMVDGYMIIDGSNTDYKILSQGGMRLPKKRNYSKIGQPIQITSEEIILELKKGGNLSDGGMMAKDFQEMINVLTQIKSDFESFKPEIMNWYSLEIDKNNSSVIAKFYERYSELNKKGEPDRYDLVKRKHQIRDWADRFNWYSNVEISFSYENREGGRLFKFIIKVISIPKIEPKIEPKKIEQKEEQTWTITYSTENDNIDKVWVYGRNEEEAIENAKDEYWDIKEIISVQKNMAKGGELDPDNETIKNEITHKSGSAGGMLVGNRHSEGGIKAINKSTNQPLEMEGGEVVITRNAVSDDKKREFEGQMLTNRQILSKINEGGGGVSFADGGDIPEYIMVSGKDYKYGGKTMKDSDIVSSCGCQHKMKDGGYTEDGITIDEYMHLKYGHKLQRGGELLIMNKAVPSFISFSKMNESLNPSQFKETYKNLLQRDYEINFDELPHTIKGALMIGNQKMIDNYINQ